MAVSEALCSPVLTGFELLMPKSCRADVVLAQMVTDQVFQVQKNKIDLFIGTQ